MDGEGEKASEAKGTKETNPGTSEGIKQVPVIAVGCCQSGNWSEDEEIEN